MRLPVVALLLLPHIVSAESLMVENAIVPQAPPTAMAHAAYMDLHNQSDQTKALIGVSAPGYAMAHLHLSKEEDGVATMTAVEQIDISPGQSLTLKPGSLHIMLMRPKGTLEKGGSVDLTLEFANGETVPVSASVMPLTGQTHSHGG